MTTLETLLKQVEELDAVSNKLSYGYQEIRQQAESAPILVEVIRKLVEQRDYEHNCLVTVGECEEMDAYNRQLDAIVAKRLGEGSGE